LGKKWNREHLCKRFIFDSYPENDVYIIQENIRDGYCHFSNNSFEGEVSDGLHLGEDFAEVLHPQAHAKNKLFIYLMNLMFILYLYLVCRKVDGAESGTNG